MRHRALFSSSDERVEGSSSSIRIHRYRAQEAREEEKKKKKKRKKKRKVDDLEVRKDDRMSPDLRIDFTEKGVAVGEFAVQIG